jgi:hypothetical protein
MNNETYNGWKNWETWNVALWIENDESLYRLAKTESSYRSFCNVVRSGLGIDETPDGARWNDENLDHDALDKLIREL